MYVLIMEFERMTMPVLMPATTEYACTSRISVDVVPMAVSDDAEPLERLATEIKGRHRSTYIRSYINDVPLL